MLCQRGTNSFGEKVADVQAGGGVAAAIYNVVASDATCGAKDKGAAGRDTWFGRGIVQAKNFLDLFGWGACAPK